LIKQIVREMRISTILGGNELIQICNNFIPQLPLINFWFVCFIMSKGRGSKPHKERAAFVFNSRFFMGIIIGNILIFLDYALFSSFAYSSILPLIITLVVIVVAGAFAGAIARGDRRKRIVAGSLSTVSILIIYAFSVVHNQTYSGIYGLTEFIAYSIFIIVLGIIGGYASYYLGRGGSGA
jgi:cation transport ATPase